MTEFLAGLFIWVSVQMGVVPGKMEPPIFQPVNVVEMAIVMCGVPSPQCPIEPATFDGNRIYYVQDETLDYEKNRELASFIVHHIVHYVQFMKDGKDRKVYDKNLPKHEPEATRIQGLYIRSVPI